MTASTNSPNLIASAPASVDASGETSVAIGIDGEAGKGDDEPSEGLHKLDHLVYN